MGLKCLCGRDFDTVTSPHKSSGVMFTDVQMDEHYDKSIADAYKFGRYYHQCEHCNRIAILVSGSNSVQFFKPESP